MPMPRLSIPQIQTFDWKGEAGDPFERLVLHKHVTPYYDQWVPSDRFWNCSDCETEHAQYALVDEPDLRQTPLPDSWFEPIKTEEMRYGEPSTVYRCSKCFADMGFPRLGRSHPTSDPVDQEVYWTGEVHLSDLTAWGDPRGSVDLSAVSGGRVEGQALATSWEQHRGPQESSAVISFRAMDAIKVVKPDVEPA